MDEARLRDKLRKLDALASDRNPNAHERAVAQRKADELRRTLPVRRERIDPFTERLKQAARNQRARNRVKEQDNSEAVIKHLQERLSELKPGDQLMAADLCSKFWLQGGLDTKQWNVIRMYIDELI